MTKSIFDSSYSLKVQKRRILRFEFKSVHNNLDPLNKAFSRIDSAFKCANRDASTDKASMVSI